jgi:hypothetical protein
MAASISNLGALTQPDFKTLSEDLGAALSYKPVTPAASLGIVGFDVGIEATQTSMSKSSQIWKTATNGSSVDNLYIPKIHVAKGLPLGFDVAAFYSKIPTTNISLYGGELRYALVDGGIIAPAVAVRGSYTKLTGVSQLSLDTKGLDLSISKGFAMFTPYAGIGEVWVTSTANVGGLSGESFTQNKVFMGANLNFLVSNMAAEIDKTGGVQSISLKLGFRF